MSDVRKRKGDAARGDDDVDHERLVRENAGLRHHIQCLEHQIRAMSDVRKDDVFRLHRDDFEAPLSASGLIAASSRRRHGVRHGYTSSVVSWKLTSRGCVKASLPEGSYVMIKILSWENLVATPTSSSSSLQASARKTFDHIFRFVHEMMMISNMVHQGVALSHSVHNHVVRVVSLMTDPLPAIVMEDWGESLHEFKLRLHENGREISFEDAVDIVLDTTAGLQQMARLGVYQWDLNAGNVLVKRMTNGRLVAKVCDFGLCRRAESRARLTSLSLTGHATRRTDNTPHIQSDVMHADDDMDAITVRAVGFLMGFIATPFGTHHSEYSECTRHGVSRWSKERVLQFANVMNALTACKITTLDALKKQLSMLGSGVKS